MGNRDHLGESVAISKKTGAVLVAPYGLAFNMKSVLGFPEKQATLATTGNVGGTYDLANIGVKVTMVTAVHGSELTLENQPAGQPSAIAGGNPGGLRGGDQRRTDDLLHRDTDLFSILKADRPVLQGGSDGGLHRGSLQPWIPCGPPQAVEWVNPKQVVPMHWAPTACSRAHRPSSRTRWTSAGWAAGWWEMKPGEDRMF